jgi:hypothetical protein
VEVAADGRDQEGAEDNVGTPGQASVNARNVSEATDLPEDGQRQPEEENKLEGVVEGKPIDNLDKALNDAIVGLAWAFRSSQRRALA